jgi:ATP-dependent DNA helicase RecQ
MRGERPAKLLLPSEARRALPLGATSRGRARTTDEAALDAAERDVFEALRRYRLERARRDGVPPYHVASDRTLREIARLRPRDAAELAQAHGIGPAKIERYGAELLAILHGA